MANLKALMNRLFNIKIKTNGFLGDINNVIALSQLLIELKTGKVVGEIQNTISGQAIHCTINNGRVVTLDIKGTLELFRVRKGWWIDKDNIKLLSIVFNPLKNISRDELIFIATDI